MKCGIRKKENSICRARGLKEPKTICCLYSNTQKVFREELGASFSADFVMKFINTKDFGAKNVAPIWRFRLDSRDKGLYCLDIAVRAA